MMMMMDSRPYTASQQTI